MIVTWPICLSFAPTKQSHPKFQRNKFNALCLKIFRSYHFCWNYLKFSTNECTYLVSWVPLAYLLARLLILSSNFTFPSIKLFLRSFGLASLTLLYIMFSSLLDVVWFLANLFFEWVMTSDEDSDKIRYNLFVYNIFFTNTKFDGYNKMLTWVDLQISFQQYLEEEDFAFIHTIRVVWHRFLWLLKWFHKEAGFFICFYDCVEIFK